MLKWEIIDTGDPDISRALVPGGWLLKHREWRNYASDPNGSVYGNMNTTLLFIPDPDHSWPVAELVNAL